MFSTRAPGKLILMGEYAVLDGAPALVMAVPRFATVHLAPRAGSWRLNAPDVLDHPIEFNWDSDGPHWSDATPPTLPDSCLRVMTHRLGRDSAFEISLSTRDFFVDRKKLGLGSSAALSVALIRALLLTLDAEVDDITVFSLAQQAHRDFQGGRGSGADIASSTFGGIIVYRRIDESPITPLTWPPGLIVLPVWTGRPASTSMMLEQLHAWRIACPHESDITFQRLREVAEAGATRFLAADIPGFLDTVGEYCDALAELGSAAGLDIVSRDHASLMALGDRCGVHYKPSGAGDGDFGLAFCSDRLALSRFSAATIEAGYRLPIAPIDHRVDRLADPASEH